VAGCLNFEADCHIGFLFFNEATIFIKS
jgi:hypothetical protein